MEITEEKELDFLEQGYVKSHTSTCRGYVSTKIIGKLETYKGRFGEGYKLYTQKKNTTQYCYCTYYLKK